MTDLHSEESSTLIAADKVEGTAVYNPDGDNLGTVEEIMLDKIQGRVAYAVMSFGGFLGMGEKFHPLPWQALSYSKDKGGFVVSLSKEVLENAPAYSAEEADMLLDRRYEERVHSHYGAQPYWI